MAGLRQGHGLLRWVDGRFFEGEFAAGFAEGAGVFVSTSGKRTNVLAEKGFISPAQRDLPIGRIDAEAAVAEAEGSEPKNRAVSTMELPLVCPKMPPPKLPAVSWSGQAVLKTVASMIDGRVIGVRTTLAKGSVDRRTFRRLAKAVEDALTQGYECRGDFVFAQDFTFTVTD